RTRIQHSKPGGSWRDWPDELIAKCHRKKKGRTYPSVYGRMKWDAPSPTITTQFYGFGNGRFGHPEQNRAISLREGSILQTFPRDYVFVKPGDEYRFKVIGRLIGNAVPVRLGEVIGNTIKLHLSQHGKYQAIHVRDFPQRSGPPGETPLPQLRNRSRRSDFQRLGRRRAERVDLP
ncbi:MAG: DNA cytosine methyltransferase, partial [Bdellovibrionota bacterium]